jgi:hypothetical protein
MFDIRQYEAYLRLIDIVCKMSSVLCIIDISPPSRHEFDISKVAFFPFEFEVTIHGDIENIEKPRNELV